MIKTMPIAGYCRNLSMGCESCNIYYPIYNRRDDNTPIFVWQQFCCQKICIMKNTEKDYRDQIKTGSMNVEKTNQDYNKRKPNPVDPNEIEGKPAVTLPIIDDLKKTPAKKDTEKADALKEAEGNNYTAAENEHQENSTL
jgi:hypothetical protein